MSFIDLKSERSESYTFPWLNTIQCENRRRILLANRFTMRYPGRIMKDLFVPFVFFASIVFRLI